MRRSVVATAAMLAVQPVSAQHADDPAADLLTVLAGALYPVQIMAYCHAEVVDDPVLRNAALQWTERNGALLNTLETMANVAGVPASARRTADEQALADIVALVASQGDRSNYCRFVAGVIDAGHFDIDQRDDLAPALKRIFGAE